jgi:hypothetical protein
MPRSGCSHTAAAVENEVRVDQMITEDHLIKTQEMCESGNRLYGTENNSVHSGIQEIVCQVGSTNANTISQSRECRLVPIFCNGMRIWVICLTASSLEMRPGYKWQSMEWQH